MAEDCKICSCEETDTGSELPLRDLEVFINNELQMTLEQWVGLDIIEKGVSSGNLFSPGLPLNLETFLSSDRKWMDLQSHILWAYLQRITFSSIWKDNGVPNNSFSRELFLLSEADLKNLFCIHRKTPIENEVDEIVFPFRYYLSDDYMFRYWRVNIAGANCFLFEFKISA